MTPQSIYAFRRFCIAVNHQTSEQTESIKVCVSGSTNIYSKSVCSGDCWLASGYAMQPGEARRQ